MEAAVERKELWGESRRDHRCRVWEEGGPKLSETGIERLRIPFAIDVAFRVVSHTVMSIRPATSKLEIRSVNPWACRPAEVPAS